MDMRDLRTAYRNNDKQITQVMKQYESRYTTILNNKRVNKVNLRKEFFRVSMDELEELVNSIDPTAEFTRTILAEEFRQSESTSEICTTNYTLDEEDEE